MPPFTTPKAVISGFKEKIDAMTVHGDRLYIGTATGSLHIYSIDKKEGGEDEVTLIETRKNLTRRGIEQLSFIKDINSLVVLSEATLTLFPLPTLAPPTPLAKTKAAFSFAVHTALQHIHPSPDAGAGTPGPMIPTLVTQLLVGCRRRAVLYTWRDGEPQEIREAPLPHSARAIAFLDRETACFAYAPNEYAVFSLVGMNVVDIAMPLPAPGSTSAMGALTGLTGYMTLGLGAKAKPAVVGISEAEVLVTKDNEGIMFGCDAKPVRAATIEWPAPPEDIAFVKPYIFSILPPGSVPAPSESTSPSVSGQPQTIPTTVVQIRSSISLLPTQTLAFPFTPPAAATAASLPALVPNAALRLLTPAPGAKSPLFFVSTPTDRTTAAADGTSVWRFDMLPWAAQLDELVVAGQYADALALLDTIDVTVLPDKDQRDSRIRALNAVALFKASKYDDAIDVFLALNINPAKILGLYPEAVSGRLAAPQDAWIPLFGGPASPPAPTRDDAEKPVPPEAEGATEKAAAELLDAISPADTIRGRLKKTGLGVFMPSGPKDDDAASIMSKRKFGPHGDQDRAIQTLVRYLTDRRPKVAAALKAVDITPENQAHKAPPLSETTLAELHALPDAPLGALTPEQLLRFAQLVDTALYKSYLARNSGLLESFCRVPNWGEVLEVEEQLRARQKFSELKDLYYGKQMHAKALGLLKELSEKEVDMEDKLGPSIRYLQKWGRITCTDIRVLAVGVPAGRDMAFEIFTSEYVELPRQEVARYLESIDTGVCTRYLEYLIAERKDFTPAFHDHLAELYLGTATAAKKRGDEQTRAEVYAKLLHFVDTDDYYSVDRLYGLVSSTDSYEARAILLGRLGRHDQALELYVHKLHDYHKAEEYCKRTYHAGTPTSGVFHTLLRIYLRPTVTTSHDLLRPALELISRHGPRLDAVEILELLPPLVAAENIRTFLIGALRAPIFDTHVVRAVSKARDEQLARRLMGLQAKRVKVTDSRICPQCHKRIGNSVIAVHSPRGEVTHYQCREIFSRRLNEKRR
ncbi:vacuolar sorting protein 39 domain 2-domain-containing protein [Infundibulicybe gibba]|nr:vacuolar sorting protein 39 domain 2-domain-containing protein [Infundibulicybe gibba]